MKYEESKFEKFGWKIIERIYPNDSSYEEWPWHRILVVFGFSFLSFILSPRWAYDSYRRFQIIKNETDEEREERYRKIMEDPEHKWWQR